MLLDRIDTCSIYSIKGRILDVPFPKIHSKNVKTVDTPGVLKQRVLSNVNHRDLTTLKIQTPTDQRRGLQRAIIYIYTIV